MIKERSIMAKAPKLEWKITKVERSLPDNIVVKVNYVASKTDGGHTISASGSIKPLKETSSLSDSPNKEDFLPFEQLTPEIIIDWVQEFLGTETISEIDKKISRQLELKKNPECAVGLPWAAISHHH